MNVFIFYLFGLILAVSTYKGLSLVTGRRMTLSRPRHMDLGGLKLNKGDGAVTQRNKNPAKSLLAACILVSTLSTGGVQAAGTSLSDLESSITSLEKATNRAETIQGLADVFEAAETKTLLVRTKYKTRIISAINDKHAALNNEWDSVLGYESGELKRRVDPFRTVDLKGYLDIAPYVGGACYLGALFIQQAVPELFVFAYPVAVLVFAAPIAFTILTT